MYRLRALFLAIGALLKAKLEGETQHDPLRASLYLGLVQPHQPCAPRGQGT